MLQDQGLQIKKKSTDDSLRTADADEILSDVNLIDASFESAAAIKVVIFKCVLLKLIMLIKFYIFIDENKMSRRY